LRALLRAAVTFSQSGAPSVHVSLLGELGDPRVRAIVARVTEARVSLLARSYGELGYSPARALARARLAYATYVGLLQMSRETPGSLMSESELERFMAEVTGMLAVPA
jgi:hypothetical protein